MYKVLLLEDDLTLQDMIVEYFIDNNYYICYCSSDNEVLDLVTKEKFDSYFKDRTRAFAIKVTNPTRFSVPQPLSKYLASNTPPQSFCYI